MIEPEIINEIKAKYLLAIKWASFIIAIIAYFILIAPSPEFEGGMHSTYHGKTLINSLPENLHYLKAYIDPNMTYTTEFCGFFMMSMIIILLVLANCGLIAEIAGDLRNFDTPPPSVPDTKKLDGLLLKGGAITAFSAITMTSAIWSNLSPEYLFEGNGFWSAIFANAPFWIMIAVTLFLFISDLIIIGVTNDRKADTKDEKIATYEYNADSVIFNFKQDAKVKQMIIGDQTAKIIYGDKSDALTINTSHIELRTS